MTSTFKVGDKVTHSTFGEAEIIYGPYTHVYGGERYAIRLGDGRGHGSAQADDITALAAFAVGDKVTGAYTGNAYEIVGGPFKGAFQTWYATKNDTTGIVTDNPEDALHAVVAPAVSPPEPIKAGDRIRVKVDHANNASVRAGDTFTVAALESPGVRTTALPTRRVGWFFSLSNVEKVGGANTFDYNGVTYDLSAKYTDKDDDVWAFARFGSTVEGGMYGAPKYLGDGDHLSYIVDTYGPLTRV